MAGGRFCREEDGRFCLSFTRPGEADGRPDGWRDGNGCRVPPRPWTDRNVCPTPTRTWTDRNVCPTPDCAFPVLSFALRRTKPMVRGYITLSGYNGRRCRFPRVAPPRAGQPWAMLKLPFQGGGHFRCRQAAGATFGVIVHRRAWGCQEENEKSYEL